MIFAYALMTSYMNNFVLKPLSKNMSLKNCTPSNYMYRKLQNMRLVIWIISAILGFSLLFIIEVVAVAVSEVKINGIKSKLGMPITPFSKNDYLIYEEYGEYSEDAEYNEENEYVEDKEEYEYTEHIVEKDTLFNNSVKKQKIETIINTEDLEDRKEFQREFEEIKNDLYKTIEKEPLFNEIKKIDFDKPIGDISDSELIKINTSSIWDAPIGIDSSSISNENVEEKLQLNENEITCEKCGMVMSKMKIACPKCGTLVKNSYRDRK